jgi:hypothetical protein
MVQQKSPISLERNRMHPTHPKISEFIHRRSMRAE